MNTPSACQHSAETARGTIATGFAFLLWGLLPVFWKTIDHLSPFELIAHRVLWSCVTLAVILMLRGKLVALWRMVRHDHRALGHCALSGGMVIINWLAFVASVVLGQVMAASLGYFLNPLVHVVLGFAVLGERMRLWQWVAVGLAVLGVANQIWVTGGVPWLSLVMALTFGIYALLRKQSRLGSLDGLMVETTIWTPLAGAFLLVLAAQGRGALGHVGPVEHTLVVLTGLVTSVPLLLFGWGARRIPLISVGLLQYLAPTGMFFLAVFAYGEPMGWEQARTFLLIWAGLALYTGEGFVNWRRRRRTSDFVRRPLPE